MMRLTRMSQNVSSRTKIVIGIVIVALIAATAVTVETLPGATSKRAVAYFDTAVGIYPDTPVRIRGVTVGHVTSVQPHANRVRIEFTYDSQYPVPADVKAGVISPALVPVRYIQLAPPYEGGPVFPDGGTIPLARTAVPLEFDDLKKQLSRLATTLGPDGVNKDGSLSRALTILGQNAAGHGRDFNNAVDQAAQAIDVLANGRTDLFGTIRNLQVFVSAIRQIDQQTVEFGQRLSSVSGILAANKTDLAKALSGIDRAATKLDRFLPTIDEELPTTVDQLGRLTTTLAGQRDRLAQVLHVGPTALTDFFNIYSPREAAVTGTLTVDNLMTPADFACNAFAVTAAANPVSAEQRCAKYLSPLAQMLAVQPPPIGVNPVAVPGGGGPTSEKGVKDENAPRPDGEADVPPPVDLPGLGGLLTPGGGGN